MTLPRKCVWMVVLVSTQGGCQLTTGLNKLEADRMSAVADGGAAASSGESSRRDGVMPASGGARAPVTMPEKKVPTAGAAGSGMRDTKPSAAGSSSEPTPDADADAGVSDCTTRISYGSAWIRPASHPDTWDQVSGSVTWDGNCQLDASGNSFAELSNGWRPFFTGRNSCVIAFDVQGSCAQASGCSTRVAYGSSWLHPDGHTDPFDDVAGVVTSNVQCKEDGDNSFVVLSNGWQPHFMGRESCSVSFRYNQCRGLFDNPVVDTHCPDASVYQDGDRYVMSCTSQTPDFPLRTSRDLVHWKNEGTVFTPATKPQWADSEFWSPELRHIGDKYMVYFNARHVDGDRAIGVATSSSLLGPYTDTGQALVREATGAIDPHPFEAMDGARYLVWMRESSASGSPTSIRIQQLAPDGLSLVGAPSTLLENTEVWEGTYVRAPTLSYVDGSYYLFYDADDTNNERSAIAVARAATLMGPYMKANAPMLGSGGNWLGPGNGSSVRAHDGSWILAFNAWAKAVGGAQQSGRQVLLTRLLWTDGWPNALGAPSSLSQPVP